MKRLGLVALCVFALAVLLVVSSGSGNAAPLRQGSVGTAITYQGRLLDEDSDPIQGTCAMTLTLWTAATAGSQVGSSQVFTSVAMSSGFFLVEPDFGSSAWTGEARWLQIEAACNGGAAETFDRQSVRAVPYAVHSLDATVTPQPTATLVETATPQPTATLVATATPQPTATPLANVAFTNVSNTFSVPQMISPSLIITGPVVAVKFTFGTTSESSGMAQCSIAGITNGNTYTCFTDTYPSGLIIADVYKDPHSVAIFVARVSGGLTIISDPGGEWATSNTPGKFCLYFATDQTDITFQNNSGVTTPANSYVLMIGRTY